MPCTISWHFKVDILSNLIYIYISLPHLLKKEEHILAMKIKNSFFITFGLEIVSVYTVTRFFCDRAKYQRSLRSPVPFSKDKLLSLHHSVWFEAEDYCCVHCSLLIGLLFIDKKGLYKHYTVINYFGCRENFHTVTYIIKKTQVPRR